MIGCHGSVGTGTFDEQGFAGAVDRALTAGSDLMEIPLLDPYGLDLAGAQRVLAWQPVTIAAEPVRERKQTSMSLFTQLTSPLSGFIRPRDRNVADGVRS
jgi:hypothetical protein